MSFVRYFILCYPDRSIRDSINQIAKLMRAEANLSKWAPEENTVQLQQWTLDVSLVRITLPYFKSGFFMKVLPTKAHCWQTKLWVPSVRFHALCDYFRFLLDAIWLAILWKLWAIPVLPYSAGRSFTNLEAQKLCLQFSSPQILPVAEVKLNCIFAIFGVLQLPNNTIKFYKSMKKVQCDPPMRKSSISSFELVSTRSVWHHS